MEIRALDLRRRRAPSGNSKPRATTLGLGTRASRAMLESPLMEQAEKSLWSALRQVAKPERPLDLLTVVWPLMVGRRLATHTRPVAWHKGRVDVAVDDPGWQSQLESMSKHVREQVNKWWGAELVREVRFVKERERPSGGRDSISRLRDETQPVKAYGREPGSKVSDLLRELQPALDKVKDTDLRELLERVAGIYLGKQGKK